jgi:hypothetical protein
LLTWPIIINYKIIFHEDYNIAFMLIILARKYKYLNNFTLIHFKHQNSTSNIYYNKSNFYLGILFCGNTLFDYHINNNPKDIGLFIRYYNLFKNDFNKGKNLFPNLFNFLMNKAVINEYFPNEQKEVFLKKIKLNLEHLVEDYEFIYNYQIENFTNNNS